MWRKLMIAALCLAIPGAAMAHLCNDVFAQAHDNLAVKVDVRDGQLRIGKTASFRVYLLNTMDRDIANIQLEVRTGGKFVAQVKPSPDWKRYPLLRTAGGRRGGKGAGQKQYFEVTLTRKPGVPDGRYEIDLHLFNGRNKSMVFKTVNLGDAAGICEVPRASGIKVDGKVSSDEWGKSYACTGLYEYRSKLQTWRNYKKTFPGKVPCRDQTSCRVQADGSNLYLCMQFQGPVAGDRVTFYAARDLESKPVKVTVDRTTGEVSCSAGTAGIECRFDANKSTAEVKIPRSLLGVTGAKGFYANFTRVTSAGDRKVTAYWRGTSHSVDNPVEYAYLKISE